MFQKWWTKSQDSVHKPQLLKRKESRSGIEPRSFRLPAYRLTARPNRLTQSSQAARVYVRRTVPSQSLSLSRTAACLLSDGGMSFLGRRVFAAMSAANRYLVPLLLPHPFSLSSPPLTPPLPSPRPSTANMPAPFPPLLRVLPPPPPHPLPCPRSRPAPRTRTPIATGEKGHSVLGTGARCLLFLSVLPVSVSGQVGFTWGLRVEGGGAGGGGVRGYGVAALGTRWGGGL